MGYTFLKVSNDANEMHFTNIQLEVSSGVHGFEIV